MLKNKIIIKGKSSDLKEIKSLLKRCEDLEEIIDNESVVLILDNEIHKSSDSANVVIPLSNKAYGGEKVLTYSAVDNRADVVALNLQPHQSSKSFELLYGVEMGRIYISKENKYSMYPVLCVAAALIAGKIPIKKVIEIFNSILK